jgi:hypothetical protein
MSHAVIKLEFIDPKISDDRLQKILLDVLNDDNLISGYYGGVKAI